MATTLGALNPFRYRGYVYDKETGFYYLKSRYYDPETCRFISADVLLSTGQGVLGHNCYTYCLNGPANKADNTGCKVVTDTNSDISSSDIASIFLIGLFGTCYYSSLFDTHPIDKLVADVKAYAESITRNNMQFHDQSVYMLFYKEGPNCGKVGYIGRTNDPIRRRNEHYNDPKKGGLGDFTVVKTDLSVFEARLWEQWFISAYLLSELENRRREISLSKLSRYGDEMQLIKDLWSGYNESEYLCLLER